MERKDSRKPEDKKIRGNRKFTFTEFQKEFFPNIPVKEFEPDIPDEIVNRKKEEARPQQQ